MEDAIRAGDSDEDIQDEGAGEESPELDPVIPVAVEPVAASLPVPRPAANDAAAVAAASPLVAAALPAPDEVSRRLFAMVSLPNTKVTINTAYPAITVEHAAVGEIEIE